jgi:hypothetical protein
MYRCFVVTPHWNLSSMVKQLTSTDPRQTLAKRPAVPSLSSTSKWSMLSLSILRTLLLPITYLCDLHFTWFGRRFMVIGPLFIIFIAYFINLMNQVFAPAALSSTPIELVTWECPILCVPRFWTSK